LDCSRHKESGTLWAKEKRRKEDEWNSQGIGLGDKKRCNDSSLRERERERERKKKARAIASRRKAKRPNQSFLHNFLV
jgi:hypothetical protein